MPRDGQTEGDNIMKKSFLLSVLFAAMSVSAFAETKGDVICAYAPSQSKVVSSVAGSAGGAAAAHM